VNGDTNGGSGGIHHRVNGDSRARIIGSAHSAISVVRLLR
jgi:hypothetical protein